MRLQSERSKTGITRVFNRVSLRVSLLLSITALCSFQSLADVSSDSYLQKIRRTHFEGPPLVWVGGSPPEEQEARDLWKAMGESQAKPLPEVARQPFEVGDGGFGHRLRHDSVHVGSERTNHANGHKHK